jgi:Tfp pilus assembly protein PilF
VPTQAHDAFASLGLPLHQAATLNNLGLVEQRIGSIAAAERTFREALALSEATGYRHGVAHASVSLGRLKLEQGHIDEARTLLAEALAVCERHNLKTREYEVHEALAEFFEKTGDNARRSRISAASTR